jgi:hypothetical protein
MRLRSGIATVVKHPAVCDSGGCPSEQLSIPGRNHFPVLEQSRALSVQKRSGAVRMDDRTPRFTASSFSLGSLLGRSISESGSFTCQTVVWPDREE